MLSRSTAHPLGFIDLDTGASRHKSLQQPVFNQFAGCPLKTQCQDGLDVLNHVEHAGVVAALGAVLLQRQSHQDPVKACDHQRDQDHATKRYCPGQARQHGQGHQRSYQVHSVLQIHELTLREIVQGVRRLLNALLQIG